MLTEKVTFSLPCLKSLVNSDNSCVFCKTNYKRSLMLLPIHLHDIKKSLREILASKVTTYDIELGGIILSYKNVKMYSSVEMNDEGHFILDYVADIYIFTPEIGSILNGRINKKCRDVLGCLVHSVFNVALPRPRCEDDSPKKWIGSKALIGQTVTFSVVKLDFTGRLPYIRGQLLSLENSGTIDDEGADSGMGYQESNEDDCSVLSINDPQTSCVENKSSLYSLKRKRNSDTIVLGSPKAKKKRFLGNSSDEGLSGEESLNRYTESPDNKQIKKDKIKVKTNILKNLEPIEPNEDIKIKEEPLESDVSSKSGKKKKKKDKENPSSVDLENLSTSLLTDALEKTEIKTENTSFEINDPLESLTTAGCSQERTKVKKKKRHTKADVTENLSFSLLNEAMKNHSSSQQVVYEVPDSPVGRKELQNSTDDRKMKKKKDRDLLENQGKSKTSTSKQNVTSQDFNKELAMPIKQDEDAIEEGKKKKKKHKHRDDMQAVSSALLEQAIKQMSVKLEEVKQEILLETDTALNNTPTKKKKSSSKQTKIEESEEKIKLENVKKVLLNEVLHNFENVKECKSEKNSDLSQSSSESILGNVRKKKKQRSLDPYLS